MEDVGARVSLGDSNYAVVGEFVPQGLEDIDLGPVAKFLSGLALNLAVELHNLLLEAFAVSIELCPLLDDPFVAVPFQGRALRLQLTQSLLIRLSLEGFETAFGLRNNGSVGFALFLKP
jgi:hypothetical protein